MLIVLKIEVEVRAVRTKLSKTARLVFLSVSKHTDFFFVIKVFRVLGTHCSHRACIPANMQNAGEFRRKLREPCKKMLV